MKPQRHISLLWKMLIWLMLHLALLATVMFFLVKWQFRSGLDGLLRGSAGDRLRAAGELMSGQLRDRPVREWGEVLEAYAEEEREKERVRTLEEVFFSLAFTCFTQYKSTNTEARQGAREDARRGSLHFSSHVLALVVLC